MKTNPRRERRISDEIIVDAYTADERAMGWYYYIEGKLPFPCKMKCIASMPGSPFAKGEVAEALRLAPEQRCMSGLYVIGHFAGRQVTVPLEQLQPIGDAGAKKAMDDWHYWVAHGYSY